MARFFSWNVLGLILIRGEQDVDTALHIVFESLGADVVFEGMCNPPGGDWSGLSFVWSKEGGEHRWLPLPRVTAVGAKRPDHVLGFFGLDDSTVCLCVESKEFARSLEEDIGPRLIRFTQTLFDTPPNVRRTHTTQEWTLFTEEWELENALFVSMGAYIANPADPFASVKVNTKLDILCGFTFSGDEEKAVAHVRALTKTGKKVLDYIVKTTGKEPCVDFIES